MRGILWIAAHPEMSLLVVVMGATLIQPANSGKYKFYKKNSDTEVRTSNNLRNLSEHQSQQRVNKTKRTIVSHFLLWTYWKN
jgi:hypothetical protein